MQMVILGMHRTGTSVVGRLLNLMGVYFGAEDAGMLPQEDNAKGFWERNDVVQLNDQILAEMNCSWRHAVNFDCSGLSELAKARFRRQASLILFKLDAHRPWFIKDPRLSLTLPIWQSILEVPVYIIVNRNPLEVARSLEKRDGISLQAGIALWHRYTLDALNYTLGAQRVFMTYEELMAQPVETTRRLESGLLNLGVSLRRALGDAEIEAAVDAKMHHNKAAEDQIELAELLTPEQFQLWEQITKGELSAQTAPIESGEILSSTKPYLQQEAVLFLEERLAQVKAEKNQLHLQFDEERKKTEYLYSELNRAKVHFLEFPEDAETLRKEDDMIREREEKLLQDRHQMEKQMIMLAQTLKHREDALQEKAAKALDAFNLLSSNMKAIETRKPGTHDREFEIYKLRYKIIRKEATINRLTGWCEALVGAIPLNSGARKAQRYFKHWISRYKQEVIKPLPAPLSKLKEDAETRRQRSWQFFTKMESAEKLLRSLLVELEHESFLPGGDLEILYSLAGAEGAAQNGNGKSSGKWCARDFSKGMEPLVSVVIPVHNQIDYTLGCLRSLSDVIEKTPFEVILVDDFSDATNYDRVKDIENISVVRNARNLGFIGSCNLGASLAKGKYVLFLNNDTKVNLGWLDSMVQTFEDHPDAGIVGSKLVYPDGTLQEAGGIIWKDASGWNYGRNDDPEKPEYNYLRETDYVSGACLMIPREIFNQVGEFDRRYTPAYYEDTDLAFKVRNAGYKVYYQPASEIVHFEGKSNGTDTGGGIKKYQAVNFAKFYEKWKKTLQEDHFDNAQNVFQARDRSRSKKLLVVIDHYVPCPDRDAGSRSTWQYIQLFCKLGFSVKFIGDNFAAEEPYTSQLEQLGVEVLHGSWYSANIHSWLREKAEMIDYVFSNRSHITIKYLDTILSMPKTKLLYYGHDLGSVRNQRLFDLTGDPEAKRQADAESEREKRIWTAAHAVYYPSEEETRYIKAAYPQVNARTIPLNIIEPKPIRYEQNLAKRRDIIFVGGFGHPPNEDGVLWFIENCWPIISKALPDIRFRIIGSRPTPAIERCASEKIFVAGWVDDVELNNRYWESRLAVIPLRYGAGVKGKVVEALHNHLPVVMTSVAAEGMPGVEKIAAIVDDAEGFARKVIEIYSATDRLASIGNKGGAYIQEHFSVNAALKAIGPDLELTGKEMGTK